jgi:hypothetical protein
MTTPVTFSTSAAQGKQQYTVNVPTAVLTLKGVREKLVNHSTLEEDFLAFVDGPEAAKLSRSREASSHTLLTLWHLYPNRLAENVAAGIRIISPNTTYVSNSLHVYAFVLSENTIIPGGLTLNSFDRVPATLTRSPYLLRVLFAKLAEAGKAQGKISAKKVKSKAAHDTPATADKSLDTLVAETLAEAVLIEGIVDIKVENGQLMYNVVRHQDEEQKEDWVTHDVVWQVESNHEALKKDLSEWSNKVLNILVQRNATLLAVWNESEERTPLVLTVGQVHALGWQQLVYPALPTTSSMSASSLSASSSLEGLFVVQKADFDEFRAWKAAQHGTGKTGKKRASRGAVTRNQKKRKAAAAPTINTTDEDESSSTGDAEMSAVTLSDPTSDLSGEEPSTPIRVSTTMEHKTEQTPSGAMTLNSNEMVADDDQAASLAGEPPSRPTQTASISPSSSSS